MKALLAIVSLLFFLGFAMADPVLYLPFDKDSGDVVEDASGMGNDGTIHGAKWTDGKFGKALDFDGVDDWVVVEDSDSLDITDEITMSCWFKLPDYTNNWAGLVRKTVPDAGAWAEPYLMYTLLLTNENETGGF